MNNVHPIHPKIEPKFPVVVIGCGFAGIGMGIKLKAAGLDDFIIFERADEVGGTWRDNTYPGCACDVPTYVYSFSFEPNPNWSNIFGQQAEIQQYLLDCVAKHQLRPHIRLNTAIVKAEFNEATGSWIITTDKGDSYQARAVITAVGGLTDPALPEIDGIENFKGEIFHTARWNQDYDYKNKRVAVIGTGCSAVQVIPSIQPHVAHLEVYQRTAAWVMPRHDTAISPKFKSFLGRYPKAQQAIRSTLYWGAELLAPFLILDSKILSKPFEALAYRNLKTQVKDLDLRKKLTPNFQFGCKRMIVSDHYYPALTKHNVDLITSGITRITTAGIQTQDGQIHPADCIIFATGFDISLAESPFEIYGLGKRSLNEEWAKNGAYAYKGISIEGYPNWFSIMGPNTGPGHTSVLIYTEAQINYIMQALQVLKEQALKYVDVRKDVMDEYNEGIQQRMKHTVWTSGSCVSWYLNADGTNHALYPGFATEYCQRIKQFKLHEYRVARQENASHPGTQSAAS
jgi:cation diffusion facilitator CzcD-associated flavoprotein CzcO